MRFKQIILTLFIMNAWIFMQECPPSDTLSIDPSQNLWNIPLENQWDQIEIMTWNIKNFPISNNTINYVNEIISDILPDIIAFQEINNVSAFNTLANSLSAYEFITSGNGLALATRLDVIEITSWSSLFPSSGYEFAWRYPLLVELNWLCGPNAISLQIINIHLKSGSSNEDFNRRYDSCEILSEYIYDFPNANFIILGDYNDEITDFENNNSLWPLVSNEFMTFATEPIAEIDYYASYPSWPSFIDHIALSEPLFDELENGNITTIRVDDYTGYNNFQNNISDHRPVLWSFPIETVDFTTELIINEIMANPESVSDALGEWIEITNVSESNINLNGMILADNDSENHVISDNTLIISPGEYLILGINDDLSMNGGVMVDYVYNGFNLSNLWDEVILIHPSGMIIDEVHYDNGITFPNENGKSMMLIDPGLENHLGENWTSAITEYGLGDFGTPGENNFPNNNECDGNLGDVNGDGNYDVIDVVMLVNCILAATCAENECNGDLNDDDLFDILDIVALTNCILANDCND